MNLRTEENWISIIINQANLHKNLVHQTVRDVLFVIQKLRHISHFFFKFWNLIDNVVSVLSKKGNFSHFSVSVGFKTCAAFDSHWCSFVWSVTGRAIWLKRFWLEIRLCQAIHVLPFSFHFRPLRCGRPPWNHLQNSRHFRREYSNRLRWLRGTQSPNHTCSWYPSNLGRSAGESKLNSIPNSAFLSWF